MNPSNNAGMELPPPVNEQSSQLNGLVQETDQNLAEQQPPTLYETNPNPGYSAVPPLPPPAMPSINPEPSATQAPASASSQTDSLITDDSDTIEKEWVGKAKAIVNKTREDPYKQSEELTLLKADYLQKQHGKTLKLNT